jgi:phosphatidylglycerol:prolipoprotein diacylglycerol transferase
MYPYEIVLGMNLYDIFLAIGVISALVFARIFADRDNVSAKLFNFILINGIVAIVLGYCSAVVTQAVYNWLDGDVFAINATTGATFLGGLVGGVVTFLIGYFVIGYFMFTERENIKYFPRLLDVASASITSAHGFGRLGCLMVGCCYGSPTDSWCGIYHVDLGYKVVPIQLFEALFLFILCAVTVVMLVKKIPGAMALYMSAYGIWRFIIEFFRGDDRGGSILGMTPSQFLGVVMIIFAVVLILFEDKWVEKLKVKFMQKYPDEPILDFYSDIPKGFKYDFGYTNPFKRTKELFQKNKTNKEEN